MKKLLKVSLVVWLMIGLGGPVSAAWNPLGPIKILIAFRTGGGSDTQVRLLAEALEATKGWKIIPQNVAGKGGANLANALKGAPPDGLTLGMAVTETFAYIPLADANAGYRPTDFTYITTTASTQMGLVAQSKKGWKTLDDLVALAKSGQPLTIAAMSPRIEDITVYIADHYQIPINIVSVRGGKGSLNAIVADDVDAGWVAGIQEKGGKSGNLVNLVSGESTRLAISPQAPTLEEQGISLIVGATFVLVGPQGMPAEVTAGIASAVGDILQNSDSKPAQFITKAFGPPFVISGQKLDRFMEKEIKDNQKLLKALN